MDLHNVRREYTRGGLRRSQLLSDPIAQFEKWMSEVVTVGIQDATAMVLATVDANHQPSQRIVLLKKMDAQGFVFFTNTQSHKALDIDANPNVGLHFPWHTVDRQIVIKGVASLLPDSESQLYFEQRPRESQLSALSSAQSQPIESRERLEQRFKENAALYADKVPVPPHWGGYVVQPQQIEFWQGGEYRLHDRFVYQKDSQQRWQVQRLSP